MKGSDVMNWCIGFLLISFIIRIEVHSLLMFDETDISREWPLPALHEGTAMNGDIEDSSTVTDEPIIPNPPNCTNVSILDPSINQCVSRSDLRTAAFDAFRSKSTNTTEKAEALLNYLRAGGNLTSNPDSSSGLLPREIDHFIDNLNETFARATKEGILVAQKTREENDTRIGVVFPDEPNVYTVTNKNKTTLINTMIIAGAVINESSIDKIDFFVILILRDSSAYQNLDRSGMEFVVSPIIIASASRNQKLHQSFIDLYFQNTTSNRSTSESGDYVCAFFHTSTNQWNQAGCSPARYNHEYQRYECTCDHQTTFALLWIPNTVLQKSITVREIISLTFLSVSILSLVIVIIHNSIVHLSDSTRSMTARDLLPMISIGNTMIVFVVFIALTITVYTQTKESSSLRCFTGANVLMFILYFCLIFMFGTKTSISYFNYLRFVRLFPEPSYRKLGLMLLLSFLVAFIYCTFAIGFHFGSSSIITQLYSNRLCWFTTNMIHYFLTIPVCLFLLTNIILFGLVAKNIISYVHNSPTNHLYERQKRCVLVLLSSCLTQGIGWCLGPILSFAHPSANLVLMWIFDICNGLEGVWTILLYLLIRSQKMEMSKRVDAYRIEMRKKPSKSIEN